MVGKFWQIIMVFFGPCFSGRSLSSFSAKLLKRPKVEGRARAVLLALGLYCQLSECTTSFSDRWSRFSGVKECWFPPGRCSWATVATYKVKERNSLCTTGSQTDGLNPSLASLDLHWSLASLDIDDVAAHQWRQRLERNLLWSLRRRESSIFQLYMERRALGRTTLADRRV